MHHDHDRWWHNKQCSQLHLDSPFEERNYWSHRKSRFVHAPSGYLVVSRFGYIDNLTGLQQALGLPLRMPTSDASIGAPTATHSGPPSRDDSPKRRGIGPRSERPRGHPRSVPTDAGEYRDRRGTGHDG